MHVGCFPSLSFMLHILVNEVKSLSWLEWKPIFMHDNVSETLHFSAIIYKCDYL